MSGEESGSAESHHSKDIQKYVKIRRKTVDCIPKKVQETTTCVVQGHHFTFFHKLEGKWSGSMQKIKPITQTGQSSVSAPVVIHSVSTKVFFVPVGGFWVLREQTALEDGAATVQHLKLSPVADGRLQATFVDEVFKPLGRTGAMLTVTETGWGAHLTQCDPGTGDIQLAETISLAGGDELTRVSNRYHSSGVLESIFMTVEKKS
eukprot:Trichotokara_eunicae@DN2590_c1_g1_i1.p1